MSSDDVDSESEEGNSSSSENKGTPLRQSIYRKSSAHESDRDIEMDQLAKY